MTIKIPVKVPFGRHTMGGSGFYRVDIATWRKVMAVVRAADDYEKHCMTQGNHAYPWDLNEAAVALRKHLAKHIKK